MAVPSCFRMDEPRRHGRWADVTNDAVEITVRVDDPRCGGWFALGVSGWRKNQVETLLRKWLCRKDGAAVHHSHALVTQVLGWAWLVNPFNPSRVKTCASGPVR